MTASIIQPYEPPPAMEPGDIAVRLGEDEVLGSEVSVHANGIVISILSREDGTVYIETYAYHGRTQQAVIQSAFIDAYRHVHPSITLTLADRPKETPR